MSLSIAHQHNEQNYEHLKVFLFMSIVSENLLLNTFNECKECYFQLRLLMIMVGSFLVKFSFLLIWF